VSISPTFYQPLFGAKVIRKAFLHLKFGLHFLSAKQNARKAALKMSVKLTPRLPKRQRNGGLQTS